MPTAVEPASESLVERKRRLVRQRIVQSADGLFLARGFDKVSVSDIAAHADVGRSTFFRYFGDKAEVVFAKEQEMLAAISAAARHDSVGAAHSAREAVEQLRPIVLALCERAAADPDGYARHTRLLEQHLELRGRDALKLQQIADKLSEVLTDRGTEETVAVFAAQICLACYRTAQYRSTTVADLAEGARAAFDQALALSVHPRTEH
jgi:AcrR family transcriptional regulator